MVAASQRHAAAFIHSPHRLHFLGFGTSCRTLEVDPGDFPARISGVGTENIAAIIQDLRRHLALCQEILGVVESESEALRDAEGALNFTAYQAKKNLLPRLDQSLNQIRQHRSTWQRLEAGVRARFPEVPTLLRQNQDLIMKIIVLDRENEQALLRRGLVPPRHLPPVSRQRPHFVADLYRRQSK